MRNLNNNWTRSRRSVLLGLARASALSVTPTVAKASQSSSLDSQKARQGDCLLPVLGRQFEVLTRQIDDAIGSKGDIAQYVMDEFDRTEAEILATPATTIDGLRVKARAACWALLGDLDSGDQSTTDKRMALSIVRDLIRLYDSELERPGALENLVKEVEEGAGRPPAA